MTNGTLMALAAMADRAEYAKLPEPKRFVTDITERTIILGQNDVMEHRGIRYAVRIGIAGQQWRVAIYFPGGLPRERTILGTFEYAEITARSMINSWLKQSALKKAKQ